MPVAFDRLPGMESQRLILSKIWIGIFMSTMKYIGVIGYGNIFLPIVMIQESDRQKRPTSR